MTLRQLEIFEVIARRLNLRAAGEELRIAQPSISYQLRLLEDELRTKLHTRNGRGVALTPAGILLLRESQGVLSRINNLKVTLKNRLYESVPATLTVGGTHSSSSTCLPSILAQFKRTREHVQLGLRTDDGGALIQMVLKGEIDLAIVHSSRRHPQILREPFGNEPVIACVSRKHPLAAKRIVTANDLKKFGFVTRRLDDTATSERFFDVLRKRGFNPLIAIECDSAEVKRAAVKSQIGIGLLYKPLVEEDLKTGELVEVQLPGGRLPGNSYIVYHKSRTLSSAARDFLELLRQYRTQLQIRSEGKRLRELFKVQAPTPDSIRGSTFNVPPPNSELKMPPRSV